MSTNPLMKLIPELQAFLETVKLSMIHDLEFFIEREIINPKLRMFSFIYSYEDFKTVVYSLDHTGETITDVVGLPIINYKNLYATENYERFVPYAIEDKEHDICNHYDAFNNDKKMDEYWDFHDAYYTKKTNIFKIWFMECWHIASKNTNTNVLALFAIHDSSGGVDLKTGTYLSDDEINTLFEN
ncbi:hypothetical protein [Psychroserpens damuponensis]|uniref:hypothetical protein n=1 Tax=Psychroserpens damuponensis TaxID=943936 RepID=UPI00058C716F|nr:hypothetical protein [Psychroserpens damuponensis]